jgi:uncharacterized protein YuzE
MTGDTRLDYSLEYDPGYLYLFPQKGLALLRLEFSPAAGDQIEISENVVVDLDRNSRGCLVRDKYHFGI